MLTGSDTVKCSCDISTAAEKVAALDQLTIRSTVDKAQSHNTQPTLSVNLTFLMVQLKGIGFCDSVGEVLLPCRRHITCQSVGDTVMPHSHSRYHCLAIRLLLFRN